MSTLMSTGQNVVSPLGNEIKFAYREDTNDLSAIGATSWLWGFSANEYGLHNRAQMKGWAIDIGAHVGAVAIALAVDHPRLRILAVEALAENCDVIRESVRLNNLENVEVIEAAAIDKVAKRVPIAYDWERAENIDDQYVRNSRFVGGMLEDPSGKFANPPGVSLSALLKRYEIDRVQFLKIDCEGCEWRFLKSPDIGRVDEIVGEYHFGDKMDGVHALLDATHEVEFLHGDDDTVGIFRAVAR